MYSPEQVREDILYVPVVQEIRGVVADIRVQLS